MDNDLFLKWEQTGLLERLSKTDKKTVSEYLENVAIKLLEDVDKNDEKISSLFLPIVRRVFSEGDGLELNYDKAKELFYELLKNFSFNENDYPPSDFSIDLEAEFAALFSEKYVERYKSV